MDKFLLYRKVDSETSVSLVSSYELINYINMSDCYYDEEYKIYYLTEEGPVLCRYKGWQPECKIEIVTADGSEINGSDVVLVGYGEDH